jgi:hypothetical protein
MSKKKKVVLKDQFHLLIIERTMRMKSLNKKFKILNFRFIMWLNKKLQLKVSDNLEELNWYL